MDYGLGEEVGGCPGEDTPGSDDPRDNTTRGERRGVAVSEAFRRRKGVLIGERSSLQGNRKKSEMTDDERVQNLGVL